MPCLGFLLSCTHSLNSVMYSFIQSCICLGSLLLFMSFLVSLFPFLIFSHIPVAVICPIHQISGLLCVGSLCCLSFHLSFTPSFFVPPSLTPLPFFLHFPVLVVQSMQSLIALFDWLFPCFPSSGVLCCFVFCLSFSLFFLPSYIHLMSCSMLFCSSIFQSMKSSRRFFRLEFSCSMHFPIKSASAIALNHHGLGHCQCSHRCCRDLRVKFCVRLGTLFGLFKYV